MADDEGDAGAAVGLCELGVPGQRIDDVAGEVGAVGRGQRGALLALEVLVQHEFRSPLERIRSTPERLKSPWNSR